MQYLQILTLRCSFVESVGHSEHSSRASMMHSGLPRLKGPKNKIDKSEAVCGWDIWEFELAVFFFRKTTKSKANAYNSGS